MKKFVTMLLASSMCLGLAACGGSSAPLLLLPVHLPLLLHLRPAKALLRSRPTP